MLDPRFIRENSELVKTNTKQRNMDEKAVDKWLEIDATRKTLIAQIEEIRRFKKSSVQPIDQATREKIIQAKTKLKSLEKRLGAVEEHWQELINSIPNIHSSDVPIGKSEEDNAEIERYQEPTKFDFQPKNHLDLATARDLLDFERGAKVSGSQFYYIKGDLVALELALLQYVMTLVSKRGFKLLHTPDLAKSRYYLGTGYQPRGEEAQTYEIKDEDLGLIATAEVTAAGLHADEILEYDQLPLKYIALSNAFRRESGAYGKYSKGLYRVHQFTKLEMFIYCKEEQSQELHQEILSIEKAIMEGLKIPYRVLNICSGDLGAMAVKKFDIEAWMPGRNDYGEVTSASNCADYQARNLNIKYRDNGTLKYVHLLNGTAAAFSRMLIAIIENYQQKDGSIQVPEVLQPYMITSQNVI